MSASTTFENFYLDNPDLQFRLQQTDLQEVVHIKEKGYTYHARYPAAPRNYTDAIENYGMMLEVLGELCARVVAPQAPQADLEGAHFDNGEVTYAQPTLEALEALRQAELMGAMLPWEYGGLNLPETVYSMMVEMISRAESGLMTVFGLGEIAASISELADESLKQRFLPRFSRGEVTGAMVLTEPDAGSDLGAVQTKAVYDEAAGIWRINGVKRFITNGCADVQLVLARSEEGSTDARGLSLFLLERDETVRIRRIENKMGLHASPTCEIQYNNTPAYLIGKRRFGLLRHAMALMNGARLAVGAQAIGVAEAAFREAFRYASARIQFGRPIRYLPAVARMLISMRAEIEGGRALLFETSRWVDLNKVYEQALAEGATAAAPDPNLRQKQKQAASYSDLLTPLTKYYNTEMGNRVCYQAMQVHGGVGYMQEFNVERYYRDVRVTNIYEGTSQLQVVAALGKLLGHALDPLLGEWAAAARKFSAANLPQSDPTVAEDEPLGKLYASLVEANQLFIQAVDCLKSNVRDVIDYYAVDLVDMACYLANSWLLLKDASLSKADQQKREVARVYIVERLPEIHRAGEAIGTADASLLQVRETLLTP
jgi:alkylation response protein AidB-like acyl-CoA dehydrogenase